MTISPPGSSSNLKSLFLSKVGNNLTISVYFSDLPGIFMPEAGNALDAI